LVCCWAPRKTPHLQALLFGGRVAHDATASSAALPALYRIRLIEPRADRADADIGVPGGILLVLPYTHGLPGSTARQLAVIITAWLLLYVIWLRFH